jgi:hypothetical protein
MDAFISLLELCFKSTPSEESRILHTRINEKVAYCSVDELHTLTANTVIFNHTYAGPSTYESIVKRYAGKYEYRSFRDLLKELATIYKDHRLRQYSYTLITINNTCICLKNVEHNHSKLPTMALYDCNSILSVPGTP